MSLAFRHVWHLYTVKTSKIPGVLNISTNYSMIHGRSHYVLVASYPKARIMHSRFAK